jgi:hypothetical protein
MRKFRSAVVACVLLALAGFTAAVVVAGKSPASILQTTSSTTSTTSSTTTSTSTTTPTTTSTSTTTTTTPTTSTTTTTVTVPSKKVTICHRTGSKKKPYHKIRVSINALKAHLRHGDILAGAGACPSTVKRTDGKGHIVKVKSHGKHKGKGKHK